MKITAYICSLALCLTACSQEDGLGTDSAEEVISFVPTYGGLTQRSIILNMEDQDLTSGAVHVMAQVVGENSWYIDDNLNDLNSWNWTTNPLFPFFETLTGTGRKKNDYEYASITGKVYYWPSSKKITFYGYYTHSGDDLNYISRTAGSTDITYTLADNPADQCDLLIAAPITTDFATSADVGIKQRFCHAMAMLRFDFVTKIEEKNDGDVVLRTIKFIAPSKGTVDIRDTSSMQQIATSVKDTVIYHPDLPVRKVTSYETCTRYYSDQTATLVFPTSSHTFQITVMASRKDGTGQISRIMDLPVPTAGFLPGYIYQYLITYSADVIDFADPSVEPWEEGPDVLEDLGKL